MKRRALIAGNWKMHGTMEEACELTTQIIKFCRDFEDREVLLAPPFTVLHEVGKLLKPTSILLGAQNVCWEDKGAFTGEISPAMISDAGGSAAIVGHSERRQYFGENDDTVNKKVTAAFANRLTPIMCVGETLEQREAGITEGVIGRQVRQGLTGLTQEQVGSMVIAYEPVWAIGTGRTASAGDANKVCNFIRRTVAEVFGEDSAARVRIQYGGSVKADNIAELMAQSDIDGALVGGASLDAATFAQIVKF